MRRSIVIFLLMLFPFQVFAARMDCRTPFAMKAAQAVVPAQGQGQDQAAETSRADEYGQTGKILHLAAQACEDADEPSASVDPGDTLTPRVTALPPPLAGLLHPELAQPALPSLFPSVPKPPPDA